MLNSRLFREGWLNPWVVGQEILKSKVIQSKDTSHAPDFQEMLQIRNFEEITQQIAQNVCGIVRKKDEKKTWLYKIKKSA